MQPSLSSHRVLARKYRPLTFKDMIGQDALVRVLSNGIQMDRLPHAFILTGIRGVGKTTTARIIARALNCIGPDRTGGPTPSPCGVCEPCLAIAEDRYIDVIEMDAASQTGVNDIRDIIEGTRYKAVSARFKIYIIDEVHMLSKNAFNAFLKTLEEPPPHVKFIFATTEIRKVPDTVLSRCMRLQLRRIDSSVLTAFLADITVREGMTIEPAALALITRAAEGSVRDGLSLLDQAMTLCKGVVTEITTLEMLGFSDRTLLFHLVKAVMQGLPKEALSCFHQLYAFGSDPLMILQDMLDFIHWMMLGHVDPLHTDLRGLRTDQAVEAITFAKTLSVPLLSRCWQILVKGLQEVALAPSVKQGVEIILLRLCYLANLPTPDEIIRGFQTSSETETRAPVSSFLPETHLLSTATTTDFPQREVLQINKEAPLPLSSLPQNFNELIQLFAEKREMLLKTYLEEEAHLISYQPGQLTIRFSSAAPKDMARRLHTLLPQWTGQPWNILISEEQGDLPLRKQREEAQALIHAQLLEDPLVKKALETFPEAEIEYVENNP